MRRRDFLHTTLAAGAGAALPLLPDLRERAPGVGAWPGPSPDAPLRLASNENPLGPSDAARRAIVAGLASANRYTHGLAMALRSTLALHHGVAEEAIVAGNGSTEVLRMAVQGMAGPAGWGTRRARLVVADPTFEHVERYAQPWGLELVKVPLRSDHAHDIQRMREAARAEARAGGAAGAAGAASGPAAAGAATGAGSGRPVLVYLCNPNNPTGTITPSDEVEAWIRDEEDVVFLVDEAYFEYVEHPSYRSVLRLALERPNVVVVRTFSKVYGLAGLRIGYGLAHPDTAGRIRAFSGLSNLNALGLMAATASVGDTEHVAASLRSNAEARRVTEAVLDELELERLPTHANFVFHRVPGDQPEYIRRMREAGVHVGRPFPPMLGHNRVSFGTPDEMARFAEVLREFRRRGWV